MSAANSFRLYLVRHGNTAANKARYVGWWDEPLDARGKSDALCVARLLDCVAVDAIHSSPFSRALDTARPLAEARGLRIETHEGLKEINFGEFQGLSKVDHPLHVRSAFLTTPMPGGESLSDVAVRVRGFLDSIGPDLAAGRSLAVFSHFWTLRVLLGVLKALPLERMMADVAYRPATGSVLGVVGATNRSGAAMVESTDPIGEVPADERA